MPLSPQIRDIDKLCPCIRDLALKLRVECLRAGFSITIYETLRMMDRQQLYVSEGVSWTMTSRHLAQPPNSLSLAFDSAPSQYMKMKHWNPDGPLWDELGRISVALGLKWGVWVRNNHNELYNKDKAHNEIVACRCPKEDVK